MAETFIHESSYVDDGAEIGGGTSIWHFCHVQTGARIGANCSLGQNVNVAGCVEVGDGVRIQNNVSVYSGTKIEDDVFLGPSCVLTNVINPRAEISRRSQYKQTLIRKGATIGANATIVCGVTVGRYAFVAAGAVVTHDVRDYALVMGTPATQRGWFSRHGQKLPPPDDQGITVCPESGWRYQAQAPDRLVCLDAETNAPLPEEQRISCTPYQSSIQENTAL